jgi:hypothetical protein
VRPAGEFVVEAGGDPAGQPVGVLSTPMTDERDVSDTQTAASLQEEARMVLLEKLIEDVRGDALNNVRSLAESYALITGTITST